MPGMTSPTGRSRWPLVLGTAALIVIIGGGVLYATTRPHSTTAAPSARSPQTPSDTPSPSATGGSSGAGDDEDAAPPTGCAGGLDRNAAMVLAAQQTAGHSAYGAVEVATAFYRFTWQSPAPSESELSTVSSALMAKEANPSFKDLAAAYGNTGDITNGLVAAGTPFHLSTTNGLWHVSPDSTNDRVTVSIATGYVIDGALSPTKVAAIGMTMVRQNGVWHLLRGVSVNQDQLANGGVRYTGGC